MNCLVVVTLGYDLVMLDRLMKSVDYPIEHKAVVNNGNVGCLAEWASRNPDWIVVDRGGNTGCAGGWNQAPILFPNEDAWLVTNDDQVFQSGVLEVVCKETDNRLDAPMVHVNQYEAYDMFVWTRTGYEALGSFDENFFPVYFEDYEYRCRMHAAGLKPYHIDRGLPVYHGKLRPAGPRYMRMLELAKPYNQQYLEAKWGALEPPGIYKTPFNMGNVSVKEWRLIERRREVLQKFWNDFWNETPTAYA